MNDYVVGNEEQFSSAEHAFIVEGEGLTSDGYFLIKDMSGIVTVTFTYSTHTSFLNSSGICNLMLMKRVNYGSLKEFMSKEICFFYT